MPELPEVETTVRQLQPLLRGRRVQQARVHWLRTLGGQSARDLAQAVRGRRVVGVRRRAKWIVIELDPAQDPDPAIIVHLRMSGRLVVLPHTQPAGPYARVSLRLSDANSLHFLDVRKFGRLRFTRDAAREFRELGWEPLAPEFTAEVLGTGLKTRRRLKPLLLDQNVVAGLGNIYVDEALFMAGLHPEVPAHGVRSEKVVRLHAAIQSVLHAAIQQDGASFDAFYRTPQGQPGRFQAQFQVYGRGGLPCRRCHTPIRRLVVAQRGTHICPRCQRAPRRHGGR